MIDETVPLDAEWHVHLPLTLLVPKKLVDQAQAGN